MRNTGLVIIERIGDKDPMEVSQNRCKEPSDSFSGNKPGKCVTMHLDKLQKMAHHTLTLNPRVKTPQYLMDKHIFRKHGANAYSMDG